MDHVIDWLLASDEPWTRYRTLRIAREFPIRPCGLFQPRTDDRTSKVTNWFTVASTWGELPFQSSQRRGLPDLLP